MCRPYPTLTKPAASFCRTFNMVRQGDFVCCCRCGTQLFPWDDKDSVLLTLPLYWEGQQVFNKTPLRGVVLLYEWDTPVFLYRDDVQVGAKGELIMGEAKHMLSLENHLLHMFSDRDIEWTFIRYMDRNKDRPEYRDDRIKRGEQAFRDAGVKYFKFVFRSDFGPLMESLPTMDVGLFMKVNNDRGEFLKWTDYPCADMEELLMRMWLVCGGNLLSDWYLPNGYDEQRIGDFEIVADDFIAAEDPINRMPAMCQLMRNGNYLGFWPAKLNDPPQEALELIRLASDYKLLYPRWLFLHDFPPSQFNDPLRRSEWDSQPRENYTPFSLIAQDPIVPKTTSSDCYIL